MCRCHGAHLNIELCGRNILVYVYTTPSNAGHARQRTKYPVFIWFIINFLTMTMIRQNPATIGSSAALSIKDFFRGYLNCFLQDKELFCSVQYLALCSDHL